MIRAIKSRRIRWTGRVAHMGEMGNAFKTSVGKMKRRGHAEDLDVDGG
jgi:hypothetical protein